MISFGVNYDWGAHQLQKAEDIPLLFNLREKAAAFTGMQPDKLQQVLVTA